MRSKISRRFVLVILIVLFLSMAFNAAWSMRTQYTAIVDNLHIKAQLLSREMSATWQFMNVNQDLINTTKDGDYEFKGLHCAIVGKSIGAIFSKNNDLVTFHFTNLTTRNPLDAPDDYEAEALKVLAEDPEKNEWYTVSKYEGETVFRYLGKITVNESCLECHGSPKGSYDVTGYKKEGWKVGDMGGAISMIISMKDDMATYNTNVKKDLFFAVAVTLLTSVLVYFAVHWFVTKPLKELEDGVQQITDGDLISRLDESRLNDEFKDLGQNFNIMTQRLQALYNTMEAQVQARTAQLRKVNEQLQKDSTFKSDFLAMMSHELRTPLTAILSFVTVLEKTVPGSENQSQLAEIERNCRRLIERINNTLELVQLETGSYHMDIVLIDLIDIVSQVRTSIQPLAQNKNIDFSSHVERDVPLIFADWDKMCSIIENLCGNAVKFTSEGGRVSLVVSKADDQICIRVSDTGIGISAAQLPYIFDKFVQGDSSASRHFNGSGLGLSIVQKMVELHHGTIQVVSEENKGSVFTVYIPITTDNGVLP